MTLSLEAQQLLNKLPIDLKKSASASDNLRRVGLGSPIVAVLVLVSAGVVAAGAVGIAERETHMLKKTAHGVVRLVNEGRAKLTHNITPQNH